MHCLEVLSYIFRLKGGPQKLVVSSTLYQAIASLIPAIVTDTRYFGTPVDEHGFGAVVKYWEVKDLVRKLKLSLEDKNIGELVVEKPKSFLGFVNGKVVRELIS